MEENKYICPKCGCKMKATYNKPALNLICPKCGFKIATTKWEEIDLDDTKYQIQLISVSEPTIEQIKCISKFTGSNFITSKTMLKNGSIIYEGFASDISEKKLILEFNNIQFSINPFFKY